MRRAGIAGLFLTLVIGAATLSGGGGVLPTPDAAPVDADVACTQSATPGSDITETVTVPPGANYNIATMRLWYPAGVSHVTGVLILFPGSNGDGTSMIYDSVWNPFATTNHMAMVGTYFTDYVVSSDEQYVQAVKGSGTALLHGINLLAATTGRCDVIGAPLLLWGVSAGGEFAFDFTAWLPERVIAFNTNKGGYYHPPTPTAAETHVPAMIFVGGQDTAFRINSLQTLYNAGRGAGAPWAYVLERTQGHVTGDSRELFASFAQAILPLRLPLSGSTLLPISQSNGYIGDLNTHAVTAASTSGPANLAQTAWLPDLATANAWQVVVNK
jgi:poly(3-hydroxybutyrate) depolymerase